MARDDQRQWISRHHDADVPRIFDPRPFSELAVRHRLPEWRNRAQRLENAPLDILHAAPVERDLELLASATQVLVELPRCVLHVRCGALVAHRVIDSRIVPGQANATKTRLSRLEADRPDRGANGSCCGGRIPTRSQGTRRRGRTRRDYAASSCGAGPTRRGCSTGPCSTRTSRRRRPRSRCQPMR